MSQVLNALLHKPCGNLSQLNESPTSIILHVGSEERFRAPLLRPQVMTPGNTRARTGEQLAADEIHLWEIALDAPHAPSEPLRGLLSDTELERASGFHFLKHKHRWTTARTALRQILATYVNAPPKSLKFRTNEFGKPRLVAPTDALQFNLTHSRNLGLLAVATHAVGIDVEYVDRNVDSEALAPHVFSDAELELVVRCKSAHERQQLFFRLWTYKEAYIKGRGVGLSLPLKEFSISLKDDKHADVIVDRAWDDGQPWRLATLSVKANYVAALASARRVRGTYRFTWNA